MPATHRRRSQPILALAASAVGICAVAAAAAEFDASLTANVASGSGLISFQCAKPAGFGTYVSISFAAIHQATMCFTAQHSQVHHVTIDWGDRSSLYSADVDAIEGEQICLPTSSSGKKTYFGEGDLMTRAWINDVLVYKGVVNLDKDASGCNVQDLYNVETLDEVASRVPLNGVILDEVRVPTVTPTDLPSAAPVTSPPTASPTAKASANPSASPTPGPSPTEHPTTAIFADRSNDFTELIYFSQKLVGPGWESFGMGPFGKCAGDCDNDDDCRPGLVCFQRSRFDFRFAVPGCAGTAKKDVDYCYDPSYQYPSAAPSLGPSASSTSSPSKDPSQTPTVTSSAAPSIALSSLPSSIPTIPPVAPVVPTEAPVVPVIENNADETDDVGSDDPAEILATPTLEASTTCGIDIDTKCFVNEPHQIEAIDCREVTDTALSSGVLLNVTWSYTLTNTCQDDWTVIARQNVRSCELCRGGSGLQCEKEVDFFLPTEDNCAVLDNTGRYLGFPPGCSITEHDFNEIKVGREETGRCIYNKEVNLRVIEGDSTKPVVLKYSFVAPKPFGDSPP